MALDSKNRAVLIEILIACGLTAIGFATGQAPLLTLATTAAGLGGNWAASLAERGFDRWRNSWFTERGVLNQDIAWALSRAFQDALRQMESDWKDQRHYKHLNHTNPEEAKRTLELLGWLQKDAKAFLQQPNDLSKIIGPPYASALMRQDRSVDNQILAKALANILYGYDTEFVTFVGERLADEWLVRFYRILSGSGEKELGAWRAFQQLWQASLALAIDEMQQDIVEIKDAVLWLQDWARRLANLPITHREPTGWDALETSLQDIKTGLDDIKDDTGEIRKDVKAILEQSFIASDALPSSEKSKVFVSNTHASLQPYREAVVQCLTRLEYNLISEQPEQLPVEQQLDLVEDCDLFVGIYSHEDGALPDTPPGESSPLPTQELERAKQSFRRSLIFVASRDLLDLTLEAPPKPIPIEPPKPRELTIPKPPTVSKGPERWFQALWAKVRGLPTPDQRDKAELDEYLKRRQEIESLQEELEHQYSQEKARYDAEALQAKTTYADAVRKYQKRTELNREFLVEVKKSFPVRRFTSEPSLVSLLKQDLDALARGEIFGFSNDPAILQRWREWVGYHRQTILDHLPYRPPPEFTSPVESLVDDFLNYAWHERVERLALNVARTAETVARGPDRVVQDKVVPYCRLPIDCQSDNYVEITYKLRDWCEQGRITVAEVTGWISEHRETYFPGYVPLANKDLERWEKAIDDLHRFLDDEPYGKCLLVMGRSGSGKTHLVARLLHEHAQASERYYLYVLPEMRTKDDGNLPPIEQLLMDTASFNYLNKPKGPRWRSFEELAHFASQGQSHDQQDGALIIIFDDLDLWIRDQGLDPEALQQFIAEHTNLHNVYWVICLSEANYDLVADPDCERFWRKYGFVGREQMPPPEGWGSLDHLNKKSQQWKEIVKYQLELSGQDMPSGLETTLDQSSKELLYNPFIAWIFGKLLSEGKLPQNLLNLNYISFVKEFWERRLDQLASETTPKRDIYPWKPRFWRAIKLTAGFVIENESLVIKRRPLVEYLVDADRSETKGFAEAIEELVDNLRRVDLLLSSYDPEAVGKYGDHYNLGFLPLWQWQTGEHLVERLPTDIGIQGRWEAWLKQYFAGDWGQEYLPGVLEFLMLLIDLGDTVPRSLALGLTQTVLRSLPSYQSEVWLAASKASAEYQYELAVWLERHPPDRLLQDRGLHRYLYFLKYAEPSEQAQRGLTPAHRLKLLRPHYGIIQMGEYFRSFLESLVENARDGRQVAEAFAYLYGIEDYLKKETRWIGVKETGVEGLAQWTYTSLWRLAMRAEAETPENMVQQWMLQFLAEVSKLVPSFSKDKEYDKHWSLMIKCHCERLAENLTKAKLDWIEANEWFKWSVHTLGISENVLFAMEEQLTTAAGQWFRENAKPRQKDNYVEAVRAWANGSSGQKGVAVFLIYHTVPSEGRYRNRPVDSGLWRIFKDLHNDPDGQVQRLMRIGKIKDWYERQRKLRTSRD